jgi:DUF4097 and DUF4098 domain-containing protein YvlB
MARYALAAIPTRLLGALVVGLCTLTACGTNSVNGSISIAAGQKSGDVATVNGEVSVGDGATVGSTMTVNGGVKLGSHVAAQSLKTVNGEISLGDATKVSDGVMTVNGALMLDKGVDVGGKLANVNGAIRLVSAHVGGGITTVNGDIEVGGGSRVEGGIHVEKPDFSSDNFKKDRKVPRIVIGPGAVVEGPLRFEREVKLYVSDSATVSGPIEGATAEKFSGDQPPG